MINRRQLLLASGALLAPAVGLPQTADRQYRIGFLGFNRLETFPGWEAFTAELAQRGYVEGRNLTFLTPAAGNAGSDLGRAAGELAEKRLDLVVALTTEAAFASANSMWSVGIFVFGSADPMGEIRANLRGPAYYELSRNRNITGNQVPPNDALVKRVHLIADVVGKPKRIAYLGINSPGPQFGSAVRSHEAQVHFVRPKSGDQLDEAFDVMVNEGVDALVLEHSGWTILNSDRIAALVARHRLPAIAEGRHFAEAGLLMSHGVSYSEIWRSSAKRIDRILKGTPANMMPWERPSTLETVVNLKTAATLGLTVPQSVLQGADLVIR